MKKLLWSIPAIALYFYTATILTEYGFISYFNIPSNFISASLSNNIIFFYQFFIASADLAGATKWYVWLIVFVVSAVIMAICYFSKLWKGIFTTVATIGVILYLGSFYTLGKVIAINTTSFIVPSASCPPIGQDSSYIVPVIGNSEAVLVPINSSNTMTGGFLIKNLSDLNCKLEIKNIGKIIN
jgi:hypothetical protein